MRADNHETNKVESMMENTRNKRLLPVFQAASATTTRMITKTTPPVVTSNGRPRRVTSAYAERVSGGTTRMVMSRAKTREATAPELANHGSFKLRAMIVNTAIANPVSTNNV